MDLNGSVEMKNDFIVTLYKTSFKSYPLIIETARAVRGTQNRKALHCDRQDIHKRVPHTKYLLVNNKK